MVPVTLMMRNYPRLDQRLQWESQFGMQLLFPEKAKASKGEIHPLPFLAYSVRPWIRVSDHLRVGAGVAGRIPVPGLISIRDWFWHEAAVSAELAVGPLRPRIEYRLPLSDPLRNQIEGSLVFQLDYLFPQPDSTDP